MTLNPTTLASIRRRMRDHDAMPPEARVYGSTFLTDPDHDQHPHELLALVAAERRRWGKSYNPAHRRRRYPLRRPRGDPGTID